MKKGSPATIIVSIISFLLLLGCEPERSGIQGEGNSNNNVIISDNVSISTVKEKEEDNEPEHIDIDGLWDEDLAHSMAMNAVFNHPFDCPNSCKYDFIGFYLLRLKDYQKYIAVISTRDMWSEARGSRVDLSFLEFTKFTKGWTLTDSSFAALDTGTNGEVFRYDDGEPALGFIEISANDYAFFSDSFFFGQGVQLLSRNIYIQVGGNWKEVLSYEKSQDTFNHYDHSEEDPPYDSYHCDLNVINDDESGLHDIELHCHGIKFGEKYDDKELFKYNGRKYVPVNKEFEFIR